MKELLNKVREFQVASDQPINDAPTIKINIKDVVMRYDLMKEENEEYLKFALKSDIVEVLDACVDMAYVLAGTINQFGLQELFEEAFSLVHANNMTKVVDGKVIRNEIGKILKPEGFVPVNLGQLFNKVNSLSKEKIKSCRIIEIVGDKKLTDDLNNFFNPQSLDKEKMRDITEPKTRHELFSLREMSELTDLTLKEVNLCIYECVKFKVDDLLPIFYAVKNKLVDIETK